MNQLPPPPPPADNNHQPLSSTPQPPQPTPYYPQPSFHDLPEESAEGGLLDYYRILRRRPGALFLISFLGGLAGLLFTFPQTPVYQARTTLEIQSMNENFLNLRDVNPNVDGGNSYDSQTDIQTQVRILQSESLLKRVTQKLEAVNAPLFIPDSRFDALRKTLGLPPPKAASTRESAIGRASDSLKVRAQPNTRLVEISCDSTNPQLAADFANTLTAEFIEQNLDARWKSSQHTGEWLTRQLEDLKIKLEKSEESLQDYARSTGLLFTAEKDNIAEQRLKQLQEELSRAQADRIARQSRFEMASNATAESLPDVLDDASLKDIQSKLTDLRRQLADLSSSLTPAHPKVKKVQAQIVTLESALDRERGNIVRRIRNDYDSARRREKLLAADYANSARLMTEQADKVAHYNILRREVDTNRQLYDSMLQRVKEAGIAGALRASNIRVVDPARTPEAPYKPSLVMNTALGLLSGLFFAVVFVVLRERADRSIQDPGETGLYLNVNELGIVPSAAIEARAKRGLLSISHNPQPTTHDQLALASLDRKPSPLAESFRSVLTSILFSGNGDRPHVIAVSSANPKEGKTTVVSNLAIALAEINQRVLLVDGDLRKPRLHHIFDLDNKTGLGDLLRLPSPLNGQPLSGLVRETRVSNLWVLPSGPHEFVANLVHSSRFPEFLERARKEFDMILIDTPPMLQIADARIIGRLADAVVLVVRANQTTRDAAQLVRRRLADDGTTVLGSILNDWNPKRTTQYGYYKYYDRYKSYYA